MIENRHRMPGNLCPSPRNILALLLVMLAVVMWYAPGAPAQLRRPASAPGQNAPPTPAGAANFTGRWANERVTVTLRPGEAGSLSGEIASGETRYVLSAIIDADHRDTIKGQFDDGRAPFPFTATRQGDALIFSTGNTSYQLNRVAANPLDNSGNGAPPAGGNPTIPAGPLSTAPSPPAQPPSPPQAQPAPPERVAGPVPEGAFTERPATSAAATGPVSAEQIDDSLVQARKYLYSLQTPEGNWERVKQRADEPKPDAQNRVNIEDVMNASQWGGLTALSVYTLLVAGESPQEPRLAKAITWLKNADLIGTYAIAMRAQIWQHLPGAKQQEMNLAIRKDVALLLENCRNQPEWKGFYRYTATDPGFDHSCSQFGVLGMWALVQAGGEVPGDYWRDVETAWLGTQGSDGGWNYGPLFKTPMPETASMTAAGVATLFITQDFTRNTAPGECRGNVSNAAIDRGLQWIADHSAAVFDMQNEWPFYTLYGLERVGLASGYKYFVGIDWFARGSRQLIEVQLHDGSWNDTVQDTCFGMLFLSRGRSPLLMSKLQYYIDQRGDKPREANWNQRPRDAANAARWVGRQAERELSWQIVTLRGMSGSDGAESRDLQDAPILYIAGNQLLAFSPKEEATLKKFVESGGLIVGNADCASTAFANTFRKLGAKLFAPNEFRELPADHPIYTRGQFLRRSWHNPASVQGLSNGARELMVLLPTVDAARFWQTGTAGGHEEAFGILANLYQYTTDRRNPKHRQETHLLTRDESKPAGKVVKVARVDYGGLWNPEPGGWDRFATLMHNTRGIELSAEPCKLTADGLAPYKIAHLTGTKNVKFNDAQRTALRDFVAGGGTLIIDATGGAREFATAIELELQLIFGADANQLNQTLPADSPIYTAVSPLPPILYRSFALARLGSIKIPRLRGITLKGRLAVIYSPEDLSVGLVGNAIDGIFGYTPETASRLMAGIVETLAK